MAPPIRRFLPLVAALLALASAPPAAAEVCNTKDGNIWDCVNYNGVGYGEIPVCNLAENVDPDAVLYAMDAWNNMIDKPIFTTGCPTYTGIVIVDVEEGYCPNDGWAWIPPALAAAGNALIEANQ